MSHLFKFKKEKWAGLIAGLAILLSIGTSACTLTPATTPPTTDAPSSIVEETSESLTAGSDNETSESLIVETSETRETGEPADGLTSIIGTNVSDADITSESPDETTEIIEEPSVTTKKVELSESSIPPSNGDVLEVHFLNVKQASSVLFIQGDDVMLVDGGDRGTSSFVVSYLKKMGIDNVDVMIATHYDADHINGLMGVLNAFDVDVVYAADYVGTTKIYQSFVNAASLYADRMLYPKIGQVFDLGSMQVRFIAPKNYDHTDVNDNSISIHVTYDDATFVIMGDQSANAEQQMLKQDLNADVYFASHHGSNGSNSKTLLDAVSPDYVVISCGAGNSYGHPGQNTLNRIANTGATLFRTDEMGTILVRTDGKVYDWSTYPNSNYVPAIPQPTKAATPAATTTVAEPVKTTVATTSAKVTASTTATPTTVAPTTAKPTVAPTIAPSTAKPTVAPTIAPTTAKPTTVAPTTIAPTTAPPAVGTKRDYVLNTNTKKFHYTTCRHVPTIKPENHKDVHDTRDNIIAQGFSPCGTCDP